jgi:hypothetical protein
MPQSLERNTLLSAPYVGQLMARPKPLSSIEALREIVLRFVDMKVSASENQTELHLVKPILKVLGYAFESKPKFFEEQVKGPDFALFETEQHRMKSGPFWGTKTYYENVLGILLVKRYGRDLEEGISGFYLAFENRIPVYQLMYLGKKAGTPWCILTNGKRWFLLRRPLAFEKRMIEIDMEKAVLENDEESLSLFYHIFSSVGLVETLRSLLERERTELLGVLQDKRALLARTIHPGVKRAEAYGMAAPVYGEFFGEGKLQLTEAYQQDAGVKMARSAPNGKAPVKRYDQSDIFSFLLTTPGRSPSPNLEELIIESLGDERTKERLFSLKILDMTPGFGNMAIQLVETVAYLSFLLPYSEKHSFVVEWEHRHRLYRSILDQMLFGIERCHISLDILQNAMLFRFGSGARNYRIGNPLLGLSISELQELADGTRVTDLFSRHPAEVISDFRGTYRTYDSLSDRIKEDAAVKNELGAKLHVYRRRVRELMDLLAALWFDKSLEKKKIRELLYYIDADEAIWEEARKQQWFVAAQQVATRNNFFHMEIEFPFLLTGRFDLIVVQPALHYLWEEQAPLNEVTKTYIKRAVAYLKPAGKLAIIADKCEKLASELQRSRKYSVETKEKEGLVTIGRQ